MGMRLLKVKVEKRGRDWVSLYECDCGNKKLCFDSNVRLGKTTSCGCYQKKRIKETNTTHGMCELPEYSVWCTMKARCSNPNSEKWPDYGGRGIKVCERWMKFENFIFDMGRRPSGTSIDRINNNGNYEPKNCRWATPLQQRHNQRRTV